VFQDEMVQVEKMLGDAAHYLFSFYHFVLKHVAGGSSLQGMRVWEGISTIFFLSTILF
jgi:hypothetical protein